MKRTGPDRSKGIAAAIRGGLLAVCVLIAAAQPVLAQGPRELPEIRTKETVYRDVRVISRNPVSITVRHSGGIAQIPLKDLSPELQAEFGFVAEDGVAFEERLRLEAEAAAVRQARELAARAAQAVRVVEGRTDRIARSFETEPEIGSVDMRPRFKELELFVKDQGRRPSCAVFAVVSALELQTVEITGQPEKLSEEYLIWATLQITGSRNRVVLDEDGSGVLDDAGFSLIEVFQALGAFGIPPQASLPNHLGTGGGVVEMPESLINEARSRRKVTAFAVPGRDKAEVVRNIVNVLNNGVPVIMALRWPHFRATQGGLLSSQEPIANYAHAVTVVGYSSASGRPEDLRFIFKNSWGPKWGANGYGFADMKYMVNNLLGAAFLDVGAPAK